MGTKYGRWQFVVGGATVAGGCWSAVVGNLEAAGVIVALGGILLALLQVAEARVNRQRDTDTNTEARVEELWKKVKAREEEAFQLLLGGSHRRIELWFALQPATNHNAFGAAPYGTLSEVANYYRALRPERLVITGAPGAGKTVTALKLMLVLLTDRGPGERVPVRLSLSSYPLGWGLKPWVADHLVDAYGLTPGAAEHLVTAGKVLPVLDGLDEMDQEDTHGAGAGPRIGLRAAAVLEDINRYMDGDEPGRLILTCRTVQYEALEAHGTWAQDAARVDIIPVNATQADKFLRARTSSLYRWQPVLDRLRDEPDGALARGLSTPWHLNLAATVYERRRDRPSDRHPGELLQPGLDTEAKVRDHLLGLLLPAAADSDTAPDPPGSDQEIRTWLTTLACYLEKNSAESRSVAGKRLPTTDLEIDELWFLAPVRTVRWVHTLLVLAPFVLLALVWGLVGEHWSAALVVATAGAITAVAGWWVLWPPFLRWDFPFPLVAWGCLLLPAATVVNLISLIILDWFALAVFLWGVILLWMAFSGAYTSRMQGRSDLLSNFFTGFIFGSFGWLNYSRLDIGWQVGSANNMDYVMVALASFLLLCFAASHANVRYFALLLLTRRGSRRWLPLSTGSLLEWCCEVGVMRRVGVAYQFRHRELQEYLARTPASAAQ